MRSGAADSSEVVSLARIGILTARLYSHDATRRELNTTAPNIALEATVPTLIMISPPQWIAFCLLTLHSGIAARIPPASSCANRRHAKLADCWIVGETSGVE